MNPQRLQEVLNAFVDDQLDAQGQRDLAQALETDEEARRAFVRATSQHQALGDLLGHSVDRQPATWKRWALPAAVAAAAVIAIAVWALRPEETPPAPKTPVVQRSPKPAPPAPKPEPPPVPTPEPPPRPEPPAPKPEPLPAPKPPSPPPVPEPKPEPKPEPPAPPPAPPPKETVIAVATLESARGEVFVVSAEGRKPVKVGHAIGAGLGVATGLGDSAAVVVFPDATRLELHAATAVDEITAAAGKRVVLGRGFIMADVADQPAGQPMVFATRHAEAVVQGTKLSLGAYEGTKLEVKEGKVRFTRLEDRRTVNVGAGQSSLAAKGSDMVPKRITRGFMMAGAAIWGEDFQEPDDLDQDWSLKTTGPVGVARTQMDVDCSTDGQFDLGLREPFKAPYRVSVDVEFTRGLKGLLVALRFQAWKTPDLVHIDVDEDRYYLRVGTQNTTLEVTRRGPRRERWTVELGADGAVQFLIDGKPALKSKRPGTNEPFHITLMVRAKDAPPATHVRFDNFLIERLK